MAAVEQEAALTLPGLFSAAFLRLMRGIFFRTVMYWVCKMLDRILDTGNPFKVEIKTGLLGLHGRTRWSKNERSIFTYYTHNIKETPSILTKCCWQDFDALTTQISAAASGHWRKPRIIQQDRDANGCLSSCIDVRNYIPFPGDVTYPGAVRALLENDTLRQGGLIKLEGLQFQCNHHLYVHCVIFYQQKLSGKSSHRGL